MPDWSADGEFFSNYTATRTVGAQKRTLFAMHKGLLTKDLLASSCGE